MKYSKQKEAIYEGLKNNASHPTAERLYAILKESNPSLSLATVYRNLNKMAQFWIIKKIQGLVASDHFDHNTGEHFHFICEICNKIYDIPKEVAPEVMQNVENISNHKIFSFDLLMKGVCENCRKKEETK